MCSAEEARPGLLEGWTFQYNASEWNSGFHLRSRDYMSHILALPDGLIAASGSCGRIAPSRPHVPIPAPSTRSRFRLRSSQNGSVPSLQRPPIPTPTRPALSEDVVAWHCPWLWESNIYRKERSGNVEIPLDANLARSSHRQTRFSPSSSTQWLNLPFSLDAPLKAKHVLSKHTQGKPDEFHQMPWIEPDHRQATSEGLQVVEGCWRWYSPSPVTGTL